MLTGQASAADHEQIRVLRVVKAYQAAFLHRQPRAICSHLTGHAKRKLVGELAAELEVRPACAPVMRGVLTFMGPEDVLRIRKTRRRLRPSDVTVSGGHARVHLRRGRTLRLRRISKRWWIADTATR